MYIYIYRYYTILAYHIIQTYAPRDRDIRQRCPHILYAHVITTIRERGSAPKRGRHSTISLDPC